MKTGDLLVGGGARGLAQYHNGVLPVVKGSMRGRRSWRGQGGKTGVEEVWALVGKGEMRHWVKGKKRTLQGIRLDIAPQRKVSRGGRNKVRGTHRGPGGSWKVGQD